MELNTNDTQQRACSFTILGEMTDLNTYIDTERANRYAAANIKELETTRVAWRCKQERVRPIDRINLMECYWFTKDLRKDADNVAFAVKFILDGMRDAGVIPNDSRKYTGSIVHHFGVDKTNPRVEVRIV